MGYKEKKGINWLNVVIGLFLLFIAIYFFSKNYTYRKKWSNPELKKKYSVATITGYRNGAKSPPWFIYEFKVNGHSYENRHSIVSKIRKLPIEQRKKFIGHQWIVKFIEEDPDYSKLLMKYAVMDTVDVPMEGWLKIPEYIKD